VLARGGKRLMQVEHALHQRDHAGMAGDGLEDLKNLII
jgi:hypothetical protein